MKSTLSLLVFFFGFNPILYAQIDSLALKQLAIQLDTLQKSKLLSSGFLGFSLKVTSSNQSILAVNEQKLLSPASTLKLITTAYTMLELGPNFRYSTQLQAFGNIENQTLRSDLLVIGSGDPSLGSHRFENVQDSFIDDWVFKIKLMGVSKIQGKIKIDHSIFEGNPTSARWLWGDIGNYYGAGPMGFNFHENFFTATIQGGNFVDKAAVIEKLTPKLSNVEVINNIKTDVENSGDQVNIFSKPFDSQIVFTGYAPKNQTINVKGTIPNVPQTFVDVFKEKLKAQQIEVLDSNIVLNPTQIFLIAENTSPPLSVLIEKCNFHSINLYAEAFLKTVASKSLKQVTLNDALIAEKQFWKTKGLNINEFKAKDGSGLSPQNFVSPAFMTDVLSVMSQYADFQLFKSSIPLIGVSGTVKNFAKNTKAVNKIYAKSGSIDGTRAYAGYFFAKSGQLLSFAIFINQYDASAGNLTKELEKIMDLMADL